MRYIFYFWFLPMSLFWGWFGLSAHDINLGTTFFSRDTHDIVFAIYSHVLGLNRETIVALLIRACIVDTAIIFGIFAFRRRKEIRAWWAERQAARAQALAAPSLLD